MAASLSPVELSVVPGGEASCEVRIRNRGSIVDQYVLEVLGEAARWASVEPSTLNLYPDTEAIARVSFRPPRSPDTPPGLALFTVRVVSKEDPAVSALVQGGVDVAVLYEISAELVPRRSQGYLSARHDLTVASGSNAPIDATASARDQDNLLRFTFAPSATVTAHPGRTAHARLRVRPQKLLWFGSPQSHPFEVSVQTREATPVSLQAQYTQKALIPRWVAKPVWIALSLLAALLAFFLLSANVPDVTGLTEAIAAARLNDAGFKAKSTGEASETVETGRVIRTDPEADQRKRRGSSVEMFVSVGRNPVRILNFTGVDAAVARLELQRDGFIVATVSEPSETIDAGRVIETEPPANSLAARNSRVVLRVSSGAADNEASEPGPPGEQQGTPGPVFPPSVNFGPTPVGGSSTQQVTISNRGSASFRIQRITIAGTNASDFAILPAPATTCSGATVAPRARCTVSVRFAPRAPSRRSAVLTITHDAEPRPRSVPLTGAGSPPSS